MNQQNYEFLTDTLERHGMGHPAVYQALKTKMELAEAEFKRTGIKSDFELKGIQLTFGNDKLICKPKFGQGDGEEVFYYMNKINATLIKENGETHTAEFGLYKQRGFNVNEMRNLLEGRPVYRRPKGEDGRWAKIDFAVTDDNGNLRVRNYYDNTTNLSLAKELGKLPIKWANPQEKEDDMRSLQNGERISAVVKKDGRAEQVFIGVSPQLGGVTMYNTKMEVIMHTNSNTIEMVPEIDLGAGQKQSGNLPETTKQLMEKINNPEVNQEQGKKQRKVS